MTAAVRRFCSKTWRGSGIDLLSGRGFESSEPLPAGENFQITSKCQKKTLVGKYIDALKYGLIGLGFLLALFSFWLLLSEQRKDRPRREILTAIYVFMAFSCVLMGFGLFSESKQPQSKSADLRVIPEAAFDGKWKLTGEDLDFAPTNFKSRNTYIGVLDLSAVNKNLGLSGKVETWRTQQLKGVGDFTASGPISGDQAAVFYDYVNERVAGFGTAFIQFDFAGQEADGYLIFRVTTGDGTIGQAHIHLHRE